MLFLDLREEFYRKEGLNPQSITHLKKWWLLFWTLFKKKNIKLDELYFHTKRQAFEVYYIPLDNNKPFVEAKKNQTIDKLKKDKKLFGVKYIYS